MSDSDNAIQLDNIYRRLSKLEDQNSYHQEDRVDMERSISSLESAQIAMAGQIQPLLDKKDPWNNIITGVGVLLTIGALALAPVVWLSVTTYNKTDTQTAKLSTHSGQIARLESGVENLQQSARIIEDRIAQIGGSRYTPQDARADREELRNEMLRLINWSKEQ